MNAIPDQDAPAAAVPRTAPVRLSDADLEAMQIGRKRLAKLERLTRMGKPGIEQLRKVLLSDIAAFDATLTEHQQAVEAANAKAFVVPGLPQPVPAGEPS